MSATAQQRPAQESSSLSEGARHAAQLRENLLQHLACTRLLLGTLADEKKALLGNDLVELERISAIKSSAADMLRDLGVQLAATRGQANAPDMETLLAQLGGEVSLSSEWQQLLQLAAKCQRANQENSALLEARHLQVRTTLRALRGQAPASVYGRTGDTGLGLTPQRLGAA